MSQILAEVCCLVHDSFRVRQVAGMFDVPLAEKLQQRFEVEVPEADEPWQIGLIVGPSGSGKSTVARQAYGERVYAAGEWAKDRAVVDGFGDAPIKNITGLLTAVGFSSPPSRIKPYSVLSGGEKFRCDLARALACGWQDDKSPPPIVVFDEFTSVVDRNTARIGSAAAAKSIRQGHVRSRFVAVTCHYDVEEWLEPDWTLDMATQTLYRRRLRRPDVRLEIRRCRRDVWSLFKRHHYLNGGLSTAARCYLATWDGVPVSFCAMLPLMGRRKHWRISRIVTLPDYQGIGIGMRVIEAIGDLYRDEGLKFSVTAAHPALLAHCRRAPQWRLRRVKKFGSSRASHRAAYHGSGGRVVASFEYLGRSTGDV